MPGQCLPCCTEGPGLHPAEHRHMGPSAHWPWGLGQPWAPGHADKAPAVVFKLVVTLLLVVQEGEGTYQCLHLGQKLYVIILKYCISNITLKPSGQKLGQPADNLYNTMNGLAKILSR